MTERRSRWVATFVSQEILEWGSLYRRIYFKNLRNETGLIVRESFCIDESESLRITGGLPYGEIVYFYADEDLSNIEFCYPHGEKYGGENE